MSRNVNEIKVVILGSSHVGKSSISLRFTKNEFLPYPITAPGTSALSKSMFLASSSNPNNNVNVHIKIWDTSGNRTLLPLYYKRADAAIIIYDITSYESFVNVQSWVDELRNSAPNDMTITICGNKNENEEREVDSKVARIYTEQFGGYYIETSAKSNVNIQQLFVDTVRRTNVFKKIKPLNNGPKMVSLKSRPVIKKRPIHSAKPSTNSSSSSSTSKYKPASTTTSTQPKKKRKFNHDDDDLTITTKKCSYCLTSNAAVLVGGIAEKPLCLLHYHTTRAIRAGKVKQTNNGNALQQQLPNTQELFAEAFIELQKEIEEESVKKFMNRGTKTQKNTDLLASMIGSGTKKVIPNADVLGIMLGNTFGRKKKKKKK